MKKLVIFLLFLCSVSVFAQDVIVKKDGSTIVCRVEKNFCMQKENLQKLKNIYHIYHIYHFPFIHRGFGSDRWCDRCDR